jgi:hypothetical protein
MSAAQCEDLVDQIAVADVPLVEDLSLGELGPPGDQAVEHDGGDPPFGEGGGDRAADEARSPGDQDLHEASPERIEPPRSLRAVGTHRIGSRSRPVNGAVSG